jgi:hypothetical protein
MEANIGINKQVELKPRLKRAKRNGVKICSGKNYIYPNNNSLMAKQIQRLQKRNGIKKRRAKAFRALKNDWHCLLPIVLAFSISVFSFHAAWTSS